jgi:hypothetical protein
MGTRGWSPDEYATYSSTVASRSTREIFSSSSIKDYLNPKGIKLRESCDSDAHPNSTAIILGLDVTGSMGIIADRLARQGLGRLVEGILDKKPVTDPHVMVMAIGDIDHDRAPIQVSQFEADIRIAEQLQDIYLEGGGGGNDHESYDLPWYFAGQRTAIDCFTKRGKKGYLFTIGDEGTPTGIRASQVKGLFGSNEETDYTPSELLAMASEKYHVFHIIVEQGSYASRALPRVTSQWRELLGKRAVLMSDYELLPEVILSVIAVSEGGDPEQTVTSWEKPHIRNVIKHALFD